MSTDKKLSQLIINKLTQEQFDTITPSNDELYLVEETSNYATVEQLATKQDVISDLATIRDGASKGATALQSITSSNVTNALGYTPYNATNPNGYTSVNESTVSGWGFTKNTGTYSKPSTGIPKTDLASAVQTSLGKADTAIQSTADCVKTSGNQTVAGVKTFTGNTVFQSANFGEGITNKRTDAYDSSICFQNSAGTKGYIGVTTTGLPAYYNPSKTRQNLVRQATADTAVGSASKPVYIDANGIATAITSYEGNSATATTATKATQDGNGNNIVNTYATKTYAITAGFPSDKVTDLTLGASGTQHIAPADGWFVAYGTFQQIEMYGTIIGDLYSASNDGLNRWKGCNLPCKKGDIVTTLWVGYSPFEGHFKFIYAEGAK